MDFINGENPSVYHSRGHKFHPMELNLGLPT